MSAGAACGLDVFRYPAVSWMNGGDSRSTSPAMDAVRISRHVGPGRPLIECLIASCAPSAASLGDVASVVYFVIDRKMLCRSMLPYSPAPDWFAGCCPTPPSDVSVSTSIGLLLSIASMMPNDAFDPMNSPCPMITAGFPVARA